MITGLHAPSLERMFMQGLADQLRPADDTPIQPDVRQLGLHAYIREMWPIIEPETPFVDGWHIGAMCEHWEALFAGQIRNLLITICPRSGKSITSSIGLPTWAWTRQPWRRFMYASYSLDLSLEHAVTSRRVLDSSWYQEHWGSQVLLTSDQNVKSYYENTRRGYRISTSTGATGRGGDITIVDDPHNLATINSDDQRAKDKRWFWKVWSSRLNDPKTGCRGVIMQRGHQDDLAADLITAGWVHLNLPTEYKPTVWVGPTGWRDPRTQPGELLSPARLGPIENAQAKRDLGPVDYAAQHDQDPIPATGAMFERQWFEVVETLPPDIIASCRFWDAAGKEGSGCFTVGARMDKSASGLFYISDIVRGQWASGQVSTIMKQTAELDGPAVAIREEREGGSAGLAVINAHQMLLAGFDYDGIPATGEKTTRWKPLAAQARPQDGRMHGNVKVLNRAWARELLDELVAGAHSKYKDQIDAVAGAFNDVAPYGATEAAGTVSEIIEPSIWGSFASGKGDARNPALANWDGLG